jgi:hypothetical protein
VNPGGFAAHASSPSAALVAFCDELRTVLLDIASGARTFEDFRTEVEGFFHETSMAALRDWEEAVQEVRAGRVTADWLGTRPADSPLGVEVVPILQPKATDGREGEAAIAA